MFAVTLLSRVPHPCRAFCDRMGILTLKDNRTFDSQPLALPRSPLRLDLNRALNPGNIVAETAPQPILRPLNQSALHRIAVHVAELLHPFALAPYVEIIKSALPHMLGCRAKQLRLRRRFSSARKRFSTRLANPCFTACTTREGSAFSGSPINRWTCSGMTTYPTTTKP